MHTERTKRLKIVNEIAEALSSVSPITLGYSGSLANSTVNESSDIDLMLMIHHSQIYRLMQHCQFRQFFQIFPAASAIYGNFHDHKIDVLRASGSLASVRINCEIYEVSHIRQILALTQREIKIVRKVNNPEFLKSRWISTDNLGQTQIFAGRYTKYYDCLLLTRACYKMSHQKFAIGPDLDRILSGILIVDHHQIKKSIQVCWRKVFSIIKNAQNSFQHPEVNSLSRLFYNPIRCLPENIIQ